VFTLDKKRGLSPMSAFGDLQRYELVLSIPKSRFGGIVGLHIGKDLRIVHQLLELVPPSYGQFLARAGNRLDAQQYFLPRKE
jgi:hypothetical protein